MYDPSSPLSPLSPLSPEFKRAPEDPRFQDWRRRELARKAEVERRRRAYIEEQFRLENESRERIQRAHEQFAEHAREFAQEQLRQKVKFEEWQRNAKPWERWGGRQRQVRRLDFKHTHTQRHRHVNLAGSHALAQWKSFSNPSSSGPRPDYSARTKSSSLGSSLSVQQRQDLDLLGLQATTIPSQQELKVGNQSEAKRGQALFRNVQSVCVCLLLPICDQDAFKRRALESHPDVNPGDKSAEKRFVAIKGAYERLSKIARRR